MLEALVDDEALVLLEELLARWKWSCSRWRSCCWPCWKRSCSRWRSCCSRCCEAELLDAVLDELAAPAPPVLLAPFGAPPVELVSAPPRPVALLEAAMPPVPALWDEDGKPPFAPLRAAGAPRADEIGAVDRASGDRRRHGADREKAS